MLLFNAQPVVLVVENEEVIRMLLSDILKDAGFIVIQAEHAEGALVLLRAQAVTIQALFTAVLMPGSMDGVALAHETQRSWPWIHLLLASGYLIPAEAELPHKSRFLHKPYQLQQVVSHLREMIGA